VEPFCCVLLRTIAHPNRGVASAILFPNWVPESCVCLPSGSAGYASQLYDCRVVLLSYSQYYWVAWGPCIAAAMLAARNMPVQGSCSLRLGVCAQAPFLFYSGLMSSTQRPQLLLFARAKHTLVAAGTLKWRPDGVQRGLPGRHDSSVCHQKIYKPSKIPTSQHYSSFASTSSQLKQHTQPTQPTSSS
jgi:hypothetical protein